MLREELRPFEICLSFELFVPGVSSNAARRANMLAVFSLGFQSWLNLLTFAAQNLVAWSTQQRIESAG